MNPIRFKRFFQWRTLLPIVLLLLLTACAAQDKEMATLDLSDTSWMYLKTEHRGIMKIVTYTYIPEKLSQNNHNDILELKDTDRKNFSGTVKESQAQLLKIRLESCPDTRSEIIEQDENSIIYELYTDNCPNVQNDYSLTRILYGKSHVYLIIFSRKGEKSLDQKKNEWLKVARSAKIQF